YRKQGVNLTFIRVTWRLAAKIRSGSTCRISVIRLSGTENMVPAKISSAGSDYTHMRFNSNTRRPEKSCGSNRKLPNHLHAGSDLVEYDTQTKGKAREALPFFYEASLFAKL